MTGKGGSESHTHLAYAAGRHATRTHEPVGEGDDPAAIAIKMGDTWALPLGVPVVTADGRPLGVVTRAEAYELLVEDGPLLNRTYALNLFDVERYADGALHLKLTAAEAIDGRWVG